MASPARNGSDIARQITVIAAVVFMVVAARVGTGLLGGTNVRDLQGGALDADATMLAPGRPAFSIWSAIYALTVVYAVWQALPSQRRRDRQRRVCWWIALTAVLNGCWLLAAQLLNLLATVIAIALLLAALGRTLHLLATDPPEGWADRILLDVTVGLHLGWVALAAVANVTAWLAADVVPPPDERTRAAWAVIVLIVVAAIGVALAAGTRTADAGGRIAAAAAMAWGLVWIGVARLTDHPHSEAVGIAAVLVAAIVLAAPFLLRGTRQRRARTVVA